MWSTCYNKARRIYELYGKVQNIGLQICEGPHKDTQELRIHAFHWFNKFLKGEDPLIETTATKLFQPQQLKVFEQLPDDQRNTKIQKTFTKAAEPAVPYDGEHWTELKQQWMATLREKVFRGWPTSEPATENGLDVKEVFSAESNGVRLSAYDFTSEEPNMVLRLYLAHRAGLDCRELDLVVFNAMDEQGWREFLATMQPAFAQQLKEEELPGGDKQAFDVSASVLRNSQAGIAYVAPRGIGRTVWNSDERKQTQIRRRFMLLGQTRGGMRVWDVARAAAAIRSIAGRKSLALHMLGQREMAGVVLYASLFTPNVKHLDLWHLPKSHHDGPIFLNVLRFLDMPQAVAMATERSNVVIHHDDMTGWEYPQQVATKLGWKKDRLEICEVPESKSK